MSVNAIFGKTKEVTNQSTTGLINKSAPTERKRFELTTQTQPKIGDIVSLENKSKQTCYLCGYISHSIEDCNRFSWLSHYQKKVFLMDEQP